MKETERRYFSEGLEIRANGDSGGRTLAGYAAVFGAQSAKLGRRGAEFIEIIAPGAFNRAIAEKHDVRALVNHESGQVLGRTASGTLRLSVDDHGLRYEVDLPDTTAARDLAESVGRGDITGSSFGFVATADDWAKTEQKNVALRTVTDLDLLDVSPVTYPAYTDTQVSVRAMDRAAEETAEPPAAPPIDRLKAEIEFLERQ